MAGLCVLGLAYGWFIIPIIAGVITTINNVGNMNTIIGTVIIGGKRHTFDSFECAIAAVAPTCSHCSCRVVGHGVEVGNRIFCCAHCAKVAGASNVADRAA